MSAQSFPFFGPSDRRISRTFVSPSPSSLPPLLVQNALSNGYDAVMLLLCRLYANEEDRGEEEENKKGIIKIMRGKIFSFPRSLPLLLHHTLY